MVVHTESEAVKTDDGNLAGAEADVSRLRLGMVQPSPRTMARASAASRTERSERWAYFSVVCGSL